MINFQTSTDAIGDLIGTIYGLEAINDPDYIDSLVTAAHAKAADQFDLAVASSASAGHLTHVYEYGVPGITRGPTRFTDPTSPAARLYVHNLARQGAGHSIGFVFRPAVIANPQPTTAHTGVPSKYLRKLSRRKYVFRQRAMVMETGMEVEIKPTRGNLLFVPFYRQESRNPLNKRGFMMYPYSPKNVPIVAVPGRETKGTFATFWQGWWSGAGSTIMGQSIQKDVNADVAAALKLSATRAAKERVEPVGAGITSTVKKAQSATEASIKSKAKARRGRETR